MTVTHHRLDRITGSAFAPISAHDASAALHPERSTAPATSKPAIAGLPLLAAAPRGAHPAVAARGAIPERAATGKARSVPSTGLAHVNDVAHPANSVPGGTTPLLPRTSRPRSEHEPKVSHR